MGVNVLDLNLYYYFKENGWYTIKNYKQHEVERKCDPWEVKRENHHWKPTQMEELLGRDFKYDKYVKASSEQCAQHTGAHGGFQQRKGIYKKKQMEMLEVLPPMEVFLPKIIQRKFDQPSRIDRL